MNKRKKRPLVSVIFPVYNQEEGYLKAAMDSILNQTLTDWEMICIDDGSSNDSYEVMKGYALKDKRFKVFKNKKNRRLAGTLNRGLGLAKGKYIARMDSDDISLPTRFEKQVKMLEENKNLVAVGCQEEVIDGKGQIKAVKYFPTDPAECYQTLCNVMPIQPPTLMVRGSVMRKYKYDTKWCPDDDIDIYFKLLQDGDFSNVDEVLFQYRQLDNSLTHRKVKDVYFMALKNRLRGVFLYRYRPSIARVLLAVLETLFIAVVPEALILKTFEGLRYVRPKRFIPSWALSLLQVSR